MAQLAPPPQIPKHPGPTSLNPNGNANTSPFIPRKEFIRDQRVISAFSLLALSSANLVRLYNFPPVVISALRRLFDHQDLIVGVSENAHRKFFEFALNHRPWASPKSIQSERLLVSILSTVLLCGYSFLSSIDYGREPDDRVALAFSKPVSFQSPSGQRASGSAVTLSQPARVPFAISFVSPSLLRVVDPPLHSTPAILQAVRGSWPLGVVSEKKFGDATYQFKLKGYKFFREDNFAADSLQQILTLLATLDSHAFALLTSITLSSRSRKQDLWIFTGPTDDTPSVESPHSSPGNSSLELRGEGIPYAAQASNEKLAPIASSYRVGNSVPATSSPLKPSFPPAQRAQGNFLRKPSPKVQIPLAFIPDADSATNSPVENKQHPFSSSLGSVGSVDMTGIGSGRSLGGERLLTRSPEIFYVTNGIPSNGYFYGYRSEHDPWRPQVPGFLPPQAAFSAMHMQGERERFSANRSVPPQDAVPPALQSRNGPSENPRPPTGPAVLVTPPPPEQADTSLPPVSTPVHSPPPVQDTAPGYFDSSVENGQDEAERDNEGSPKAAAPDMPRTPTPPAVAQGAVRDSAYSSTAGYHSYEIPITWSGRDPEFGRSVLTEIKEDEQASGQRRFSEETERPREQQPRLERFSAGPLSPGAWAPTLKDDRRPHDVANMLPPTIREQPSQELDEHGRVANRQDGPQGTARMTSRSPELGGSDGDQSRGDQTVSSGTSSGKNTQGSTRTPTTGVRRTRRETDASGWVLVNIDRGNGSHADSKGKGRQTQSVSPDPSRRAKSPSHNTDVTSATPQRQLPHMRSSSDSRLPPSLPAGTRKDAGGTMSGMHPAAKAIVIIDALGAKEKKEHEKPGNGSGFRRMFARSRDKEKTG